MKERKCINLRYLEMFLHFMSDISRNNKYFSKINLQLIVYLNLRKLLKIY